VRKIFLPIQHVLAGKCNLGEKISIQGWVKTRRDSKAGVSFLEVNEGSCLASLQVVAPQSLPNYQETILKLTAGCAIQVSGTLVASLGKEQSCELQAEQIILIGSVMHPESYPIQAKKHSVEYLREVAHLRPRTNLIGAISRLRHTVAKSIHSFFDQEGFFWVNTPIITGSDCEGAGDLFRVSTLDLMNLPKLENGKINFQSDFFGQEAFLTVSGQLNAEAYCLALSKVYTFGPTFRAENSHTSRHLAEFWMVEPEMAFADLNDCANLAERLLKYVFNAVLMERVEEIDFFTKRVDAACRLRLEAILAHEFERVEYKEAIQILQKANKTFQFPVSFGLDLQTEHERYLTEEHFGRPAIIVNYPKQIKSFYMRLNEDNQTVAAMDVLAPGIGEIIGGSQREERLDYLMQRMDEANISKEHYEWYLDLRRYGSVPHGGFGLGFERLLSYISGLSNVRDVIPFPRVPGQAKY